MKANRDNQIRSFRPCLISLAMLLAASLYMGCESRQRSTGPMRGIITPAKDYMPDAPGFGRRAEILPPSSVPSLDEEVWIIARRIEASPSGDEAGPESGALLAKLPGQRKQVPLPLQHTDVKASVNAYIASVEVKQEFQNPYDGKIEAVYVFPLPHDAAINEFIMTIGQRRIRGS